MKHFIRAVVAGLAILFLFASPVHAKTRIAVMDFDNKAQYGGSRVGYGVSDMIATNLVKFGKYSVLERDKLASILKKQDVGMGGRVDPGTALKLG